MRQCVWRVTASAAMFLRLSSFSRPMPVFPLYLSLQCAAGATADAPASSAAARGPCGSRACPAPLADTCPPTGSSWSAPLLTPLGRAAAVKRLAAAAAAAAVARDGGGVGGRKAKERATKAKRAAFAVAKCAPKVSPSTPQCTRPAPSRARTADRSRGLLRALCEAGGRLCAARARQPRPPAAEAMSA